MPVSSIPLTEVEAWGLMALDEGLDPECQSRNHLNAGSHSGQVVVLQIGLCEHSTGFRCAGWVAYISARPSGVSKCGICGLRMAYADLRLLPLGDVA